jgi:8-oxo-dGTP pyrophosphatase MutT (NUDIX family)
LSVFEEAELRRRAVARLLQEPQNLPSRSDDDMNAALPMIPPELARKPAAVLVPLVLRPAGTTMLLTKRRDHLSSHAGQIAFPGGRIDGEHETPVAAALREAFEETGVGESYIEPIGYLDGYMTVTSYAITPVVALLRPGFTISPQDAEVADVFEVPLAFLMDAANHQKHARDWNGGKRYYYAMPYGERYIWGATAGMIRNLYERMYA